MPPNSQIRISSNLNFPRDRLSKCTITYFFFKFIFGIIIIFRYFFAFWSNFLQIYYIFVFFFILNPIQRNKTRIYTIVFELRLCTNGRFAPKICNDYILFFFKFFLIKRGRKKICLVLDYPSLSLLYACLRYT